MSEPVVTKRKLSPPAQIALVVVGLLLVAALGYFVLIGPKRSAASELDAEIASTEAKIAQMRAAVAANKPVEPIRAAELFRLSKAMPDEADMAGVILELNEIAQDTGIQFESIAPQGATVTGEYQVLAINLAFDGNFYSLSDFLFRLRNLVTVRDGKLAASGRLFAVRSLTFAQGQKGFPDIKADMTVDAFVYGTGTPVAAAPPAAAPPGTPTTTDGTSTTPAPTTPAPADPSTPPTEPAPTAAGTPGATS